MSQAKKLQIDQLGMGESHLIEANAGTGKTYAIANLFLRFVLEKTPIKNLLVVTFSNAASDELRGRIRKRLHEARSMFEAGTINEKEDIFFRSLLERYPDGTLRNEAKQRLALALLDISDASIYTIHSFCQQALSDQAFSSGQAFELEQADDNKLKSQAIQDWWRKRTYELSPNELSEFHNIFNTIESLKKQIAPLLKTPSPVIYPTAPDSINEIKNKLRNELDNMAQLWLTQGETARELLLSSGSCLNRKSHNINKLQYIIKSLDNVLLQTIPGFPQVKELAAISRTSFKFNKTATDEIRDRFNIEVFTQSERLLSLIKETHPLIKLYELNSARRFVQRQLTIMKQKQGLLSFDDMIAYLHHALHHNGNSSNELATRLAQYYPLILIDEFQDTDPLQYAIFNRIHKADDKHTLIMIGDPKQAIYGFRGGDIFTYMQARREVSQHWSLATNWRSTPEIIDAVNTFFGMDNAFTYSDISYIPSEAAPDDLRKARSLFIDNEPAPAIIVEDLPRNDENRVQAKTHIEKHVHQAVASRIAELLYNRCTIGKEPLKPADIAILVRESKEATAIKQELLKHGIHAVSAGKDNIWESDEAIGLRLLLEAALLPDDRQCLRQAAAAPFLKLGTEELLKLTTSPSYWGAWVELIYKTGSIWQKRSFMPAFQTLIQGLASVLNLEKQMGLPNPAVWLSRVPNPERCLTNLFHLAELLQQASKEHPGGEQLIAWMKQQQGVNDDEYQLRLESDEDLVKITTVHNSKGLEFPVVFVPYLWHCKPVDYRNNTIMSWHKENNGIFQHYFCPWRDENDPVFKLAEHERLAEDIRLAYVALTRAASHCHIIFGAANYSLGGHSGRTALSWLLSDCKTNFDNERFSVDPDAVSLETLKHKNNIKVIPPRENLAAQVIKTELTSCDNLEVACIDRKIRMNWQIGSYSAMTRNVHQATRVSLKSDSNDFALNYKAGANVGSFLHELLEFINPAQDIPLQLKKLLPSLIIRHNQDKNQDPEPLAVWLHNILHTPLDNNGLVLANLNPEHRLCELEFSLSVKQVDCNKLNTLLRNNSRPELPALEFKNFQGMVTGVIDLVFEHEGKYYLADYKSNLLGRHLGDYTADILNNAIADRRYDLQYLIYTLALHRHLRQRIQNYDYKHHFGGVYYLFLRAMRPETGNDYGIYFTLPDYELIRLLDEEIFASGLKKSA